MWKYLNKCSVGITISSSNVILDLSNYEYTIPSNNGNMGIYVIQNVNNVTILNGTITNFGIYDIYINSNTSYIKINNLKFKNNSGYSLVNPDPLDPRFDDSLFSGSILVRGTSDLPNSNISIDRVSVIQ